MPAFFGTARSHIIVKVDVLFLLSCSSRGQGSEGERRLKRPWPEPYAIAVTFTASHISPKTVQKALLSGHLNRSSGLSSPALPNNPCWFCPIWISFPSLSLTVNNPFVVTPFPTTHNPSRPIFNVHQVTGQGSNQDCYTLVIGPEERRAGQRLGRFSEPWPKIREVITSLIAHNNVKNAIVKFTGL